MIDYDDDRDCPSCMGTGIGDPHAETRCSRCRGSGVVPRPPANPDEPDEDWMAQEAYERG